MREYIVHSMKKSLPVRQQIAEQGQPAVQGRVGRLLRRLVPRHLHQAARCGGHSLGHAGQGRARHAHAHVEQQPRHRLQGGPQAGLKLALLGDQKGFK